MRRILLLLATMVAAVLVASGLALAAPPVTDTESFSNTGTITLIQDFQATPYPSVITVSGFPSDSQIKDVNLTLNGFSHSFPEDVDMLLVAPSGESALVMSDAGGSADVNGISILLDNQAQSRLPDDSELGADGSNVSYKPANYAGADTFPSPAPTPGKRASLSVFNRTNPNGDWQLFIVDAVPSFDSGSIEGGWTLTITATI
jgi:subtilisin-like proprotein convertase family protein